MNFLYPKKIIFKSLVHFIRQEGINLFDKPETPEITDPSQKMNPKKNNEQSSVALSRLSKHDQVKRDFKTDTEWLEYTEWLENLSKEAMDHFIRGVQIGIELNESWLVCQGCAYAWNYMHHIFENKHHNKVNHILTTLLEALKKTGHDT